MIEVPVTQNILKQAAVNAHELGSLRNSITTGDGNMAGFIGEIVVAQFLGAEINNTYDYDLLLRGTKIDVKSKRTSVPPRPYYECSIAAYNVKQACDHYVFVRVHNESTRAWILGYLPKKVYFEAAKLLKKGDIDPSNNFTVKADCYNVAISALWSLEDLMNDKVRRD